MALISLLLPDLRGGGAERVSVDLADAFADLGHSVEFLLSDAKGEFLAEARQRHRVVNLNATRARNVTLPLARHIRDAYPAALIAAMWPLSFVAPLAARLSGRRIPVLVVEHCFLSNQYQGRGIGHRLALRSSLGVGLRLATAGGGVSSGVAADAAQLACLPANRVKTLFNPIPLRPPPKQESLERAESLWRTPGGRRILTVGSLKAQKNHRLLLHAFAQVADPETELLLLGQGGLEPEVRALADSLGITGRVIFAGFHADPTPFYMTADLFVLSSDYEGLPTVLIEALSCGLPVVSTDCPSGPSEILEAGRHGILTPVGDAPALARAIREALERPWDREALKARAADFSPRVAARKYLEAMGLA